MEFSELNWINVGPDGTFKSSGDVRSTKEQVDSIFSHLNSLDRKKLVIHFHGGLVSESDGMSVARSMEPVYSDAGSHALTFVWETGFWETLKDDWHDIAKDSQLLKKIIAYASGKILGSAVPADTLAKGVGERPRDPIEIGSPEEAHQFESYVDQFSKDIDDVSLRDWRDAIEQELEHDCLEDDSLKPLLDGGEVTRQKGLGSIKFAWFVAKIAYRVIRRKRSGTDHGWYASVVEEALHELGVADIGRSIWGSMKEKSQTMWVNNAEGTSFENMNAGNLFLSKLDDLMGGHPNYIIDVVGHSAGAIACINMIRAIDEKGFTNIKIRNIAFLAPAARMEIFDEEIIQYSNRFDLFRMFTMYDELELKDTLVGDWDILYPSSLLYFISGVLEGSPDKPLIGLERHFSGESPYDTPESLHTRCRDFLTRHSKCSLVLSKSIGTPGLESEAEDHGEFDNDSKTRESLIRFCL